MGPALPSLALSSPTGHKGLQQAFLTLPAPGLPWVDSLGVCRAGNPGLLLVLRERRHRPVGNTVTQATFPGSSPSEVQAPGRGSRGELV